MAPRSIILITGLAGSGKTTLANRIAKGANDALVLHADEFRYKPGTWVKLPRDEYEAAVCAAIDAAPQGTVVIESSYHDASDPEQARAALFTALLPATRRVLIIKPTTAVDQVAALIDRSIRRATGAEPPGAAIETSTDRAKLVVKATTNFSTNVQWLDDLTAAATEAGVPVHYDSRDALAAVN